MWKFKINEERYNQNILSHLIYSKVVMNYFTWNSVYLATSILHNATVVATVVAVKYLETRISLNEVSSFRSRYLFAVQYVSQIYMYIICYFLLLKINISYTVYVDNSFLFFNRRRICHIYYFTVLKSSIVAIDSFKPPIRKISKKL